MRKPSIREVAKLANVSTATVSHAINGTRAVAEDTIKRINDAIEKLEYYPNYRARGFRTGKTGIIGFIVPDIANEFFSTIIENVENVLSRNDCHLLVANTKETPEREFGHIKYLSTGIVDGILLASTLDSYESLKSDIFGPVPIVLVDRQLENAPYDSITVSSYNALYQSVCKLIANGCKNIGYISGLMRLSTFAERLSAYKQALLDNRLPINENIIQYGDSMHKSAFSCTKALIEAKCDAIVVSNGQMSRDVFYYLKRHSIDINDKLPIVSFLDFNTLFMQDDYMYFVEQPVSELGRLAGEKIIQRIKNPDMPIKNIILQSNFLEKLDNGMR